MSKKKPGKPQDRASNVNIYPLSADEALKRVMSISKEDAKRIVNSRPGKKRKSRNATDRSAT